MIDIRDVIRHYEALQKRYMKAHNGRMCEITNFTLKLLYDNLPAGEKVVEDITLNSCPFCGGEAKMVLDKGYSDKSKVVCKNCGKETIWYFWKTASAAAWNNGIAKFTD